MRLQGARILVVDDNEINLKVFVSLLNQTRMQIETADSGDACIELFKRNFYDVIFLDHMMPDKDGIETLKEMKALHGYAKSENAGYMSDGKCYIRNAGNVYGGWL